MGHGNKDQCKNFYSSKVIEICDINCNCSFMCKCGWQSPMKLSEELIKKNKRKFFSINI